MYICCILEVHVHAGDDCKCMYKMYTNKYTHTHTHTFNRVKHRNIVELFELFDSKSKLYLVMEL